MSTHYLWIGYSLRMECFAHAIIVFIPSRMVCEQDGMTCAQVAMLFVYQQVREVFAHIS